MDDKLEDFVVWDDSYSVGFEAIDNQHKQLIRMTNELFQGCARGHTVADIAFMKAIRGAVEYAQVHFFTEEKYMKQTEYPDLLSHRKEHESFVATVRDAVKTFEEGKSKPIVLARFLKNWLLTHIAQVDKKYAPCLAKLNR